MHYVILITHQSDIKICTTNSFSGLPVSESHHSNSNRSLPRCVCAMRSSLIAFPFFKTSKALLSFNPSIAPRVLYLTMYEFIAHIETTAGMT